MDKLLLLFQNKIKKNKKANKQVKRNSSNMDKLLLLLFQNKIKKNKKANNQVKRNSPSKKKVKRNSSNMDKLLLLFQIWMGLDFNGHPQKYLG